MPTPVIVTLKIAALQYDGTNSADILAMANSTMSVTVFTLDTEDETGLALASSQPSVWAPAFLAPGDWCLAGGGVEPAGVFTGKWHVLGDA